MWNAKFVPYVTAPDSVMCLYHNAICAAIPEWGQWLEMEKIMNSTNVIFPPELTQLVIDASPQTEKHYLRPE